MLKKILKTYGRHRADELKQALLALAAAELVQSIVTLFTSGELRFRTKKRVKDAGELCEQFRSYNATYPHVADCLLRAAQCAKSDQHRTRYSIGALTEDARWDAQLKVEIPEGVFKIPNELRALFARLLVMRDPSLCGMFTIHPSVVDDVLVIDGRSWSEFAAEHHAALWPERKRTVIRKPPTSATAVQGRREKLA